jgi:hypothetical protein
MYSTELKELFDSAIRQTVVSWEVKVAAVHRANVLFRNKTLQIKIWFHGSMSIIITYKSALKSIIGFVCFYWERIYIIS